MTTRAPQWFETYFVDRVTHVLQSQGYKTKGMTTDTDNIKGNVARWRISGSGEATPHPPGYSDIGLMDVDRSYVEGTIADFDADDFIKERDIEKMSVNEKAAVVMTGAKARGRKYDELLLDQLITSANVDGAADASLVSPTLALQSAAAIQGLQMGMGKINLAVPQMVMANWMMYEQLASAGWNGEASVAKMTTARSWMGINIFVMEDKFFTDRRPATGTNNIYLMMWHTDCVGRVMNADKFDGIFWEPSKKAWRINQSISGVCKTILPTGVRLIQGAQPTTVTIPSTNG